MRPLASFFLGLRSIKTILPFISCGHKKEMKLLSFKVQLTLHPNNERTHGNSIVVLNISPFDILLYISQFCFA